MILSIVAVYAGLFVAFGFVVDTPGKILHGLIEIATSRDTLLTDYFGVGGVGAGLVNAGLLTLVACLIYRLARAKMTGASVAALFAGRFGWYWGVVAGFIHSSAALSVGSVHGGLNLYNNGFAAGIVASILAPVIIAIQSRSGPVEPSEGQKGPPGAAKGRG